MSSIMTLKPRMSEKSYALSHSVDTYVFDVPTTANKIEVARAVTAQFKVTVEDVRIAVIKGKQARSIRIGGARKMVSGKRADTKKAYVRIKKGDSIPIFASIDEAEEKAKKAEAKAAKKSGSTPPKKESSEDKKEAKSKFRLGRISRWLSRPTNDYSSRRGMSTQDLTASTTNKPLKSLLVQKKQKSGRNNQGRITTSIVVAEPRILSPTQLQLSEETKLKVEQIEYDPNRSARIARVKDESGAYHYILASAKMKPGQTLKIGEEASIENGNRLKLINIPTGSTVHAIELEPGRGAQLVRSAGTSAQLMAKDNGYAQLRLPSGEVRLVNLNCMASIGVIGNEQHQNIKIGKAGRNRHKGIRPSVRGVVMNAADHPHGGGDGGRHGIGGGKNHGAAPKTPWGQKTLGFKTRRRKNTTNIF